MTDSTVRPLTMLDATEAFAVPGDYGSIIDCVHPETGLSWVNGETLDQIRQRYPNAQIVNFHTWMAEKAQLQDTPITWARTTKAKYWEMLEVLPPAAMYAGAFLVGEPTDHHAGNGRPRFAAYWQRGSSEDFACYFVASRPLTCAELKAEVTRGRA